MPLDEPSWWYEDRLTPFAALLRPVAWIYGTVAGQRMRSPTKARLPIPVICIGNFTAGGTGKTPLAITIAALLREAGRQPVFLSRGYGGHERGPHLVHQENDSSDDVGDEPLLLATHGPTVVSRDRAAGGEFIVARALGDVVVMDDGLQNRALHKNYTLAVVDRRRELGNRHVIPAGPLRAPIEDQLAMVDGIVINDGAIGAGEPIAIHPHWLPDDFHGDLYQAATEAQGDVSWLAATRLVAYAGIANPERFFALLRQLGGQIERSFVFRDHHAFTDTDVRSILDAADACGGQLVTTAKDAVRLAGRGTDHELLRQRSRVLHIGTVFSEVDRRRLIEALLRALAAPG